MYVNVRKTNLKILTADVKVDGRSLRHADEDIDYVSEHMLNKPAGRSVCLSLCCSKSQGGRVYF